MECTALMVVHDNGTERFMSVEIDIMDGIMPKNNTRDIMRIVSICNNVYVEKKNVVFIDMYGIITRQGKELWEVEEDAV